MELQSSDDEYFDTCSDVNDNSAEAVLSNNYEPNNLSECVDQQFSPVRIDAFKKISDNIDSKIEICNTIDSNILLTELTRDNNQDCEISELRSNLNETNINESIDESSDSDSFPDEFINSEINNDSKEVEDKVNNDDNVNKVDSEASIEIEKTNEEIQIEERLNLESLLTDEKLEELRQESVTMKDEGNAHFKSQSYETAVESYTSAMLTCPLKFKDDHAIFHANRGTALAKLEKYDDSIGDLSAALQLKPDYLKALSRRAELREKTDKLSEALEDYRQILKIDPRNWAALHAEQTLPERIRVQQEKMKEEMLGQLKQLGNLVLKPFGLSTDNFKMVQDPATGSYSINFQNK